VGKRGWGGQEKATAQRACSGWDAKTPERFGDDVKRSKRNGRSVEKGVGEGEAELS